MKEKKKEKRKGKKKRKKKKKDDCREEREKERGKEGERGGKSMLVEERKGRRILIKGGARGPGDPSQHRKKAGVPPWYRVYWQLSGRVWVLFSVVHWPVWVLLSLGGLVEFSTYSPVVA